MCRAVIPNKEVDHPIVRTNDVLVSKWLYQGRDGVKWWRYDEETSDLIERGYQLYLQDDETDELKFHIGNTEYSIDFAAMRQHRVADHRISRKIRRIEAVSDENKDTVTEDLIKGIAGITIVKVPPPIVDDDEMIGD